MIVLSIGPFFAPDDKVTQRQDKITFQSDRVFIIGIVQIDVHRVDVVRGSRGNINDLPLGTELLYQRPILIFRVSDNDVVLRQKEHIDDLTLGRERFAASWGTEKQPIGVFSAFFCSP